MAGFVLLLLLLSLLLCLQSSLQVQFIHIGNRVLKGIKRTKSFMNHQCQLLILSTISYFQTSKGTSTWVLNMPLFWNGWSFPLCVRSMALGQFLSNQSWLHNLRFKTSGHLSPKEQGQLFCINSQDFISGQLSQGEGRQQVNQIPLTGSQIVCWAAASWSISSGLNSPKDLRS